MLVEASSGVAVAVWKSQWREWAVAVDSVVVRTMLQATDSFKRVDRSGNIQLDQTEVHEVLQLMRAGEAVCPLELALEVQQLMHHLDWARLGVIGLSQLQRALREEGRSSTQRMQALEVVARVGNKMHSERHPCGLDARELGLLLREMMTGPDPYGKCCVSVQVSAPSS